MSTETREHKDAHAVVRTGAFTAVLLTVVMFAGLLAANRIPALERYALERNAVCYGLFFVILLLPVVRFLNRPVQMFAAAMLGWVLFVGAYNFAGLFFRDLFRVLRTPFELLIEGAVVYGVCAAGSWVATMLFHARTHTICPDRPHVHHIVLPPER